MGWKYIMFKMGDGRLVPIIFPDFMVHNEVANGIRRAHPPLRTAAIDSAGSIDGVVPTNVHGQSETLRTRSNPRRDTSAISSFQYAHGYAVRVEARVDPDIRRPRVPAQERGTLDNDDRKFLRLLEKHDPSRDFGTKKQ